MYRRLEGEGLSLCWLVGAARIYIYIYICHASLSVHNYCWRLLCIVCSAIADIATCIPTGYAFFVLLDTQVQSLSRWSAVVHTSCHKNHKWSGRPTPFRCSGGTGSSSGWSKDLGERFEFWTPTNWLDISYPPPLFACIVLLFCSHRSSSFIPFYYCSLLHLGCSYSLLVQYATEEGCYWNI